MLSQTFKQFECIIIDDGSTDNTKDIVFHWGQKDKRFLYSCQDNADLSNARNKGGSLSSGKYILPLDSDDKRSDDYLEKCVRILNSNSKVKIAYGVAYFFGISSNKWNFDIYNF